LREVSLSQKLRARAAEGRPIRIALIGAGKFGAMFLAQAGRTAGFHVAAIADLAPARAEAAFERIGWPRERYAAGSIAVALKSGGTWITDDAAAAIAADGIEVVIDATGHPASGIRHALLCCAHRKHLVMVNVEADVLAGPLLARRAAEAGIVYSMAYGDQPALIAELVDWAETAGFDVVAAGKGAKYLPAYHASTPDTVWDHYGLTAETAAKGGMNPQMFNSFLDGTKSAIEMAAVANATGLTPAPDGLAFPACGVDDLPRLLKPRSDGGVLDHKGQVEVISSLERDGRPVFRDLRWGVYVVIEGPSEYVRRCFAEYGLVTDPSGHYTAMYKPYHLIGLELGISVASAALRGEATGSATGFRGDAVAVAKRALKAGETLDGEGGYTVYGRLMPAADSLAAAALPIGLAHGVKLVRDVAAGAVVRWGDVAADESAEAVRIRREMESLFRGQEKKAPHATAAE
jgi:predicted homoserine dehydrogenase-like protein